MKILRSMSVVSTVVLLFALLFPAVPANAESAVVGYRDFSYSANLVHAPTGEKPQSKLWFAGGTWWGALFSKASDGHNVYRLDRSTQTWSDTGVTLDPRNAARLDVLWDGTRLYVVGAGRNPSTANDEVRVSRYSLSAGTYTIDSGFPRVVASGGVEAAVIDKDTAGKLWVTYTRGTSVYVAHSTTTDATWTAPFVIPVPGADTLTSDDISSLVAYDGRIGVMWSNQSDSTMYFASHADGAPDGQWDVNPAVRSPGYADDHINLKSLQADEAGRVYAVTKTEQTGTSAPLILVMVLDRQGSWSRSTFGRVADNHTRPLLLIDDEHRRLYVFAAPCCDGGTIYYKESPLSNVSFEPGMGTPFIQGIGDRNINNPTSTKQPLSSATGMVVIASDDVTDYYLHNDVLLNGGADTTSPDTTVDTGPAGSVASTETSAMFTFSSSTPNSTFECSLDGAPFASCASPSSYEGLAAGAHTFAVRATDAAGNVDSSPATRAWVIEDEGDGVGTPSTVVFKPVADARVQEASPKSNYNASYLFTDAGVGENIESYLRFSVAGLSGTVQSARLRVYATTDTGDGPEVFATSGAWTESGLTWASRPSRVGAAVADVGKVPANSWVEYDVTGVVSGDDTVDLALVTGSEDGIKFTSREDAVRPPELVITTE